MSSLYGLKCMFVCVKKIGGLYLQFMSIWTVVSNGLARGWLIALHVNRMLRSWRPSGPNVISLFTLRPPFVSYVSLIIGILSLYQWMTGIGLPVNETNKKIVRMRKTEWTKNQKKKHTPKCVSVSVIKNIYRTVSSLLHWLHR